jgi:hypothetical protein
MDCSGVCDGEAVVDDCGVCGGDGSACSCSDLTVTGCDAYSDGWDGATLTVGSWSWSGPANAGTWTYGCEEVTACIDLAVANDITMGGGSYAGEHSWSISLATAKSIHAVTSSQP